MKLQLQKTIAELVITKEFLKLELDFLLTKLNAGDFSNAEYLPLAHKLNDVNNDIRLVTTTIKNLMLREKEIKI